MRQKCRCAARHRQLRYVPTTSAFATCTRLITQLPQWTQAHTNRPLVWPRAYSCPSITECQTLLNRRHRGLHWVQMTSQKPTSDGLLYQPLAETAAIGFCVVTCKIVALRVPMLASLPVGCFEDGAHAALTHRCLLCPLHLEAPERHIHARQAADWMRSNPFAPRDLRHASKSEPVARFCQHAEKFRCAE